MLHAAVQKQASEFELSNQLCSWSFNGKHCVAAMAFRKISLVKVLELFFFW